MARVTRVPSGRYVSRLTSGTLAVIMAGGRGERLKQLTDHRCKPATPFGGKFRIIDFVLSNCVNSGIRQILLLTQYKAQSLIQHVHHGWGYLRGEFNEFVEIVPAQQQVGQHWYRGTADAVYQNLDLIRAHRPTHVLVLAGDHIYKMDYGPMIAAHLEKRADITVGVVQVLRDEAHDFGVMTVDESLRVLKFAEKPPAPDPMPGDENLSLVSMGIYVFNTRMLERLLHENAENPQTKHDFGRNVIPESIGRLDVFAYPFQDVRTSAQAYWRDVGNVDAYYEANMELVQINPELNIYDQNWPIWTYQRQYPPAKFVLDEECRRGMALNSLVSGGVIVSGSHVSESVLFSNVRIAEQSYVERCVVLPDACVGKHCIVKGAVLDEGCDIPDGTQIGVDREADQRRFFITKRGIVLVTPDMLRHAS